MTTLKTMKDGRVALIFETEQVTVAAQIFSAVVGGNIPTFPKVERTLADIREAVAKPLEMRLNHTSKAVSKLDYLDAEKLGDEICSIIFEEMHHTYGRAIPAKFRAFYRDLQIETGELVAQGYKAFIGNRKVDVSKYPNRKIDYVLKVMPAEFVHQFAKEYKFEEASA